MISITFFEKDHSIVGFRMSGHARYKKSGQDIVCASVSILAINTVNAIETFTDDLFDYSTEDGFLAFRITSDISEKSSLLLNSLQLGIIGIHEEYSKYIVFKNEEV